MTMSKYIFTPKPEKTIIFINIINLIREKEGYLKIIRII